MSVHVLRTLLTRAKLGLHGIILYHLGKTSNVQKS